MMKIIKTFDELNEGTGNFYSVNATKIFAIGGTHDAGEEEGEESYDSTEDDLANVRGDLKKAGYDMVSQDSNRATPHKDNRSFSGTVLASKTESDTFGRDNVGFDVTIYAVARNGYYEGACLDWEMETSLEGTSYWDDDEIGDDEIRDAFGEDDLKAGQEDAQADAVKKAAKWIEETKSKLTADLEKIYKDNSTPLTVSARFSSGETHYKKADESRIPLFKRFTADRDTNESWSSKDINESWTKNKDYDKFYDELVPGRGPCKTVEGEMLRAISRIVYRYYNDGDYYFKGYGKETAGPAYKYLTTVCPKKKELRDILVAARKGAVPNGAKEYGPNDGYANKLEEAVDLIIEYIKGKNGNYEKNSVDMLMFR